MDVGDSQREVVLVGVTGCLATRMSVFQVLKFQYKHTR